MVRGTDGRAGRRCRALRVTTAQSVLDRGRLRRCDCRGELPALLRGPDGRALGAARALFPDAPVGYFEGIDSERGLEWRSSDSLSLRAFLRLGSRDRAWLSRSRTRLPHEVHAAVFEFWFAEAGLIEGRALSMPRPWRPTRRCGTSCGRRRRRAGAPGPGKRGETPRSRGSFPTRLGSKSDPEAKIAKMKDGTTHLAASSVVAAELHPADEGDTTTLSKPCRGGPGLRRRQRLSLRRARDSPWKTRIAAPKQTGALAR